MNYFLHEFNIKSDKSFTKKTGKNKKIQIGGLSKKVFDEKKKEAAKQAQQKKDYSLDFHVIGTTFLNEAGSSDENVLVVNGRKYKIGDGKFSFTRGYIYVGNNEFIRVAFRVPFIFWFLLLGLVILGIILGIVIGTHQVGNPNPGTPTPGIDLPIDGSNEGDTTPNLYPHGTPNEEFTEITVYPEVVVDATTPNIPLYNSENNTVYFVYHIYEGGKLLHETGLIPPGYRVQWNAKSVLSVGKHDLTFVIDCYDIKTKAPCDGATTHCAVTVE